MNEQIVISKIDAEINNSLIKENITELAISKMEKEFMPLKLKSLDDKESYLVISDNRKKVKNFRVLISKICKAGREDAVSVQKKWIEKEKELVGRVSVIESHLQSEESKFEEEKKRKEQEKERQEQENLFKRQMALTKMGAELLDGHFVLESAKISLDTLKKADDETFETIILPEFQPIFEKREKERLEFEAEQERIKAEQEAEVKRIEEEKELMRKEMERIEAERIKIE